MNSLNGSLPLKLNSRPATAPTGEWAEDTGNTRLGPNDNTPSTFVMHGGDAFAFKDAKQDTHLLISKEVLLSQPADAQEAVESLAATVGLPAEQIHVIDAPREGKTLINHLGDQFVQTKDGSLLFVATDYASQDQADLICSQVQSLGIEVQLATPQEAQTQRYLNLGLSAETSQSLAEQDWKLRD